jgi:hypothetical protein
MDNSLFLVSDMPQQYNSAICIALVTQRHIYMYIIYSSCKSHHINRKIYALTRISFLMNEELNLNKYVYASYWELISGFTDSSYLSKNFMLSRNFLFSWLISNAT